MRGRVPYLTAEAWRERQRQQAGSALGRGYAWDSCLLPADAAAWEAAAHHRAMDLVRSAPSLCAKLPPELCELITAALLRLSGPHLHVSCTRPACAVHLPCTSPASPLRLHRPCPAPL